MLEITIKIVIGLVALFHVYVMWLEMFAWTTKGPKTFKNFDKELFPKTKAMAANQGLYNGFLAAGLIWSFFISNPEWHFNVSVFFLSCVAVAGIYGAATADKKIFFVQGLPALIGILLLVFHQGKQDAERKKEPIKHEVTGYYFIPNNERLTIDTVKPAEIQNRNDKDSLIGLGFIDNPDGKGIGVSLFTDENHHQSRNGNSNSGYIQGIGKVYEHAITWRDFKVLHTTSDSLNRIIALGLGRLITLETERLKRDLAAAANMNSGQLNE